MPLEVRPSAECAWPRKRFGDHRRVGVVAGENGSAGDDPRLVSLSSVGPANRPVELGERDHPTV
jgi:hypothetical protein